LCVDRAAAHWFAALVWVGLFPCPRAPDRFDRPPSVRRLVSSLRCRTASSELLRAHLRPYPFGSGSLPGFSTLIATSPGRVHQSRSPPELHSVPSSGVHSLSTVYSASWLRGLLHPRAAYRVPSRSGASHSAQRLRPHRAALPPCRWPPGRSVSLSARRPHQAASTSRPRSAQSSVHTGSVMSLADGRSPPRVDLLQVRSPRMESRLPRDSPLVTFTTASLRSRDRRRRPAYSVSPPRAGHICLQTRRPAREFRA